MIQEQVLAKDPSPIPWVRLRSSLPHWLNEARSRLTDWVPCVIPRGSTTTSLVSIFHSETSALGENLFMGLSLSVLQLGGGLKSPLPLPYDRSLSTISARIPRAPILNLRLISSIINTYNQQNFPGSGGSVASFLLRISLPSPLLLICL